MTYKNDNETLRREEYIDNTINEIISMLDETYNIEKQIKLSKCLVMLYTLKKELIKIKKIPNLY